MRSSKCVEHSNRVVAVIAFNVNGVSCNICCSINQSIYIFVCTKFVSTTGWRRRRCGDSVPILQQIITELIYEYRRHGVPADIQSSAYDTWMTRVPRRPRLKRKFSCCRDCYRLRRFLSLQSAPMSSMLNALRCPWGRRVESSPCSCKLRCPTFVPFVPCEFSRSQPLADALLWHDDSGTKFSPAFRWDEAMTRTRHVRQCLDIVSREISFPTIKVVPAQRKMRKVKWVQFSFGKKTVKIHFDWFPFRKCQTDMQNLILKSSSYRCEWCARFPVGLVFAQIAFDSRYFINICKAKMEMNKN